MPAADGLSRYLASAIVGSSTSIDDLEVQSEHFHVSQDVTVGVDLSRRVDVQAKHRPGRK
jgi:hypothetical protein